MSTTPASAGRDAPDNCPGTLRVHAAADGGLARIRVPGGRLTGEQLTALALAATELGNGLLELTSRANVQVRGLEPGGEIALAARLAAAGLLPSQTHELVRNVVASPLSGRVAGGLLDVRPLVAELDRRLCAEPGFAELSGRFLFTLDDGRGDVVGARGDVGMIPVTAAEVLIPLAGRDHSLCTSADLAVDGMLSVARAFLAERAAQGGTAWRLSDLVDGPARILARLPADPRAAGLRWSTSDFTEISGISERPIGLVPQLDGRAALVTAPRLGRLDAAQAGTLAVLAAEVVLTPWRTILVPDLDDVPQAVDELTAVGLICDPDSPWVGVTACTGRPGCAKSLADVRGDAPLAAHGTGGPPVHWAGCERRCGQPSGRHVEVLATRDGYAVSLDGQAAHDIESARRQL